MKYFGTDGIRGTYGDIEISEPFFAALGLAVSDLLKLNGGGKIVVGGDTRASTDTLKSAFCGGLAKGGAQFEDLGVLPTPALAYGVLAHGAKMGAMITASHNPYTDNGIKFFDASARKVEDDTQEWLENRLEKYFSRDESYKPKTFAAKKISVGKFATEEYAKKMASIFPKNFLKGVKIAIDMANGATSKVSSKVFAEYGAEVFEVGCEPSGLNINDAIGSQHPEKMSAIMQARRRECGFRPRRRRRQGGGRRRNGVDSRRRGNTRSHRNRRQNARETRLERHRLRPFKATWDSTSLFGKTA